MEKYKIIKCWDVGYTIQDTKTGLYLGWLGVFDKDEKSLSNEMVRFFDSIEEAEDHINTI